MISVPTELPEARCERLGRVVLGEELLFDVAFWMTCSGDRVAVRGEAYWQGDQGRFHLASGDVDEPYRAYGR